MRTPPHFAPIGEDEAAELLRHDATDQRTVLQLTAVQLTAQFAFNVGAGRAARP